MHRTRNTLFVRPSILKHKLKGPRMAGIALAVSVSLFTTPPAFAVDLPSPAAVPSAAQQELDQAQQQIQQDKAGFAAAIVARWENAARASGKWDPNYAVGTYGALMKLGPENLLAAGQATSYEELLDALALGSLAQVPQTLGSFSNDLVYTPINPCRIVDTRNIFSPIIAGSVRNFDVDNPASFAFQGGFPGACPGMPFGVASAVAVTITATQTAGPGFFTAWSFCGIQPVASTVNYSAGDTIANTTIVPDCPGGGSDISVFAGTSTAHLVIDLVGYFSAPVATALDNNVLQTITNVAAGAGSFSIFSPACPAGWRLTGGGSLVNSFTGVPLIGARPAVFGNTSSAVALGVNNANSWLCQGNNIGQGAVDVECFSVCARVPGR
jgi:hypothetical protein